MNFLGLRRSMAAMLAMAILVGMGENMAERFLPIYLLALGGGALAVSVLNGMDNLLSALYSFPGGYLSDRLGYKRALLVFNLIAMAGYLIVIFIPAWWAVIVGGSILPVLVGHLAAGHDEPGGGGAAQEQTHHGRVDALAGAAHPHGAGTGGGRAADRLEGRDRGHSLGLYRGAGAGRRGAGGAAVLCGGATEGSVKAEGNPLKLFNGMSGSFRILLVADILVRFSEQIPYAFMAIWVIKNNGLSPVTFGVLTTIEMVTAMLVYIPVAYLADRGSKKPFVAITFGFFTLFPLVLHVVAQLLDVRAGVCHPRAEGIWRTDAQGADHGPGAGRAEGRHVWVVLFAARCDRFGGSLQRRLSVEYLTAGQFPGRLWLWPARHAVFCDFWQGCSYSKRKVRYEMDYPFACAC